MTDARIYTKLGDDGSTGRLFGGRISKADLTIDTIGCIDETVATLGLARAACTGPYTDSELTALIVHLQRDLFVVGADLIAQPKARNKLTPGLSLVTAEMVAHLEEVIDELIEQHPLKPVFIVPGANQVSAGLDMARAQVRTAERRLVAMRKSEHREPDTTDPNPTCADHTNSDTGNPQVARYLNRVSDLLFVLARRAAGDDEEPASHDPIA